MKICSKLNGGKQMWYTALIVPSAFLLLKARKIIFFSLMLWTQRSWVVKYLVLQTSAKRLYLKCVLIRLWISFLLQNCLLNSSLGCYHVSFLPVRSKLNWLLLLYNGVICEGLGIMRFCEDEILAVVSGKKLLNCLIYIAEKPEAAETIN